MNSNDKYIKRSSFSFLLKINLLGAIGILVIVGLVFYIANINLDFIIFGLSITFLIYFSITLNVWEKKRNRVIHDYFLCTLGRDENFKSKKEENKDYIIMEIEKIKSEIERVKLFIENYKSE